MPPLGFFFNFSMNTNSVKGIIEEKKLYPIIYRYTRNRISMVKIQIKTSHMPKLCKVDRYSIQKDLEYYYYLKSTFYQFIC